MMQFPLCLKASLWCLLASLEEVQVSRKAVLPLYTDIYNIAATYYSFFLSCKIHKEILHCLLLVTPRLV